LKQIGASFPPSREDLRLIFVYLFSNNSKFVVVINCIVYGLAKVHVLIKSSVGRSTVIR